MSDCLCMFAFVCASACACVGEGVGGYFEDARANNGKHFGRCEPCCVLYQNIDSNQMSVVDKRKRSLRCFPMISNGGDGILSCFYHTKAAAVSCLTFSFLSFCFVFISSFFFAYFLFVVGDKAHTQRDSKQCNVHLCLASITCLLLVLYFPGFFSSYLQFCSFTSFASPTLPHIRSLWLFFLFALRIFFFVLFVFLSSSLSSLFLDAQPSHNTFLTVISLFRFCANNFSFYGNSLANKK